MKISTQKALDDALEELASMSDDDFKMCMEESKSDPLYSVFTELERFGEFLYSEYEPTQYNINMPWSNRCLPLM